MGCMVGRPVTPVRRVAVQLRTIVRTTLVLCIALGICLGPPPGPAHAQGDPRFFPETGFRVANDAFWDYFQRRGGLRMFGYPVSRELVLDGFRVQFFQRRAMQLQPDGKTVQLLNVLEARLLPYGRFNGSVLPGPDPAFAQDAPRPGERDYAARAVAFVRERVHDTFQDPTSPSTVDAVNFLSTFQNTISAEEAAPETGGDPEALTLLNLEMWGLPLSKATRDPANPDFIYQRFQRGVMHYDRTCGCTEGLLVADYLKALITGRDLPADLAADATGSRFAGQYDRRRLRHLAHPDLLPGTDVLNAFEREDRALPRVDYLPTATITVRPKTEGADQVAVGELFTVTVRAEDDLGVKLLSWDWDDSSALELYAPPVFECGGQTPCEQSWDAVRRLPGALTLRARAEDTAGQRSDELPTDPRLATASLSVASDAPKVQVDVTSRPIQAGVPFTVRVSATDDTGVRKITWGWKADGHVELEQPPELDCAGDRTCEGTWRAIRHEPGTLALHAVADDVGGRSGQPVSTTVDVVPPQQPRGDQKPVGPAQPAPWTFEEYRRQGIDFLVQVAGLAPLIVILVILLVFWRVWGSQD